MLGVTPQNHAKIIKINMQNDEEVQERNVFPPEIICVYKGELDIHIFLMLQL